MKKLLPALCISLFLFLSACEKDDLQKDIGVITSADTRYCGCCGGWFIELNGETRRFLAIPENSRLDLKNETLPIQVKLYWKDEGSPCMNGDRILVAAIKKVE